MGELPCRLGQDFPHPLFLIWFQGLGLVLCKDTLDFRIETLSQGGGSPAQPGGPNAAI